MRCHPAGVCSFKLYIDTVFGEKMDLLTDVVSRSAASGSPLDLHDLMYRFTLDSFGQIGFGVDPGCLRTTDKVPFAAAFDSAQVVSVQAPQAALHDWVGRQHGRSRQCQSLCGCSCCYCARASTTIWIILHQAAMLSQAP